MSRNHIPTHRTLTIILLLVAIVIGTSTLLANIKTPLQNFKEAPKATFIHYLSKEGSWSMEKKAVRLPDAELEVMKIIWDSPKSVSSADIMEELQGKKTWGVTTVLNLLTRLLERGFVACERKGRFNWYTPVVDEKTYLENESKSILEKLYGNSIKSFVASLYEGNSLTKNDLEELREFIDKQTKEE